jgi:hypothetical protein
LALRDIDILIRIGSGFRGYFVDKHTNFSICCFCLSCLPPPTTAELNPPYPVPNATGTPEPFATIPDIDLRNLQAESYLPAMYNNWALGSPKKGLAWAFASTYPGDYLPFHVRWYHDWGTSGPVDHQHMEFIPFIKCDYGTVSPYDSPSAGSTDLIALAINNLDPDYDGYLLILNEPNFFNSSNPQCDKHPDEAAQIYVHIRDAFPNAKIVGPNLSEDGLYSAIEYVELWRAEVLNLTGDYPDVSGYGIHSYRLNHNSTLNSLNDFHQAMQAWGEGAKELWLMEFGFCGLWGETHADEFEMLVDELESVDYDFVTRYAYYTTRQRDVIDPGDPTPTLTTWEICDGTADLYELYTFDLSVRGEVYQRVGLLHEE